MQKRHIIVLIALSLIISACQKDEIIQERDYPRLDLSEEILMSDEGAVFEASILTQNVEILDKGFVWGYGVFPEVESEPHISLGGGDGAGDFSTMSSFDLVDGKEYYLHAYAITSDRLVYSKAIKFISTTNGPGLSLDSFMPGRGRADDTVVLSGSNLSYYKGRIKVLFSNVSAAIQSSTDSTITVKVPELKISKTKISVSINGVQEEFEEFFVIDGK